MKGKRIRIVRYADDILIFAKTHREAVKNLQIATEILEDELKLKVNTEKTHITDVNKGVAYTGIHNQAKYSNNTSKKIAAFKGKIREMTPRNHGMNVEEMVKRINPVLRGWANYYRIANCKKLLLS